MGRCILICRCCHVLNNWMLMNHFPIWEPGEKNKNKTRNIRGLFDIIPVIHKAHDRCAQRAEHVSQDLGCLSMYHRHLSVPLHLSVCLICLSRHLSLSGHPSLHRGSYFSLWRAGRGSKYAAPQTADPEWPRNPCVSDASPKVSHSKAPVLQRCVCSSDPVIHQPARSPARSYWFLFPQSPGERERKD